MSDPTKLTDEEFEQAMVFKATVDANLDYVLGLGINISEVMK